MPVYTGPDQTCVPLLAAIEEKISEFKTLDAKLSSAKGDRDSAITQFMEASEDEQAVKLRKAIETATSKLRELADKNVKVEQLSEAELTKLETERNTVSDAIRHARKAVLDVAKALNTDPEGVSAALDTIGDPTRSNRGRKPGEAGSSLPRLSAYIYVEGPGVKQSYNSVSAVAIATNGEAEDIQKALAKAAGVDYPANFKNAFDKTSEIKFEFEVGDKKFTAIATPKQRQNPGPRPAAPASAPAEAEAKTA